MGNNISITIALKLLELLQGVKIAKIQWACKVIAPNVVQVQAGKDRMKMLFLVLKPRKTKAT
jgi:hypothetical protein